MQFDIFKNPSEKQNGKVQKEERRVPDKERKHFKMTNFELKDLPIKYNV